MAKQQQTWRGLHSVYVLLIVCEFGRPVKMSEVKEKTDFNIVSLCLHYWAKRGCVEHDVDAHTWCINDVVRLFAKI